MVKGGRTKEGDRVQRALDQDGKQQAEGIQQGIEAASNRAKRTRGMPVHRVRVKVTPAGPKTLTAHPKVLPADPKTLTVHPRIIK